MNLQFGKRLVGLREGLGLTQDQMIEKLDVGKRSYCAYEAGETAPSAKLLTALALIGVDIAYLLTGTRTGDAAPVSAPAPKLRPDEEILLDNYRHCDQEGKLLLEKSSVRFAQSKKKAA